MKQVITDGVSIDQETNETTIEGVVAFIRWDSKRKCLSSGWSGTDTGPPPVEMVAEALASLTLAGARLLHIDPKTLVLATAAALHDLGCTVVHDGIPGRVKEH